MVYGFHGMLPRDGRLNWLRLARDWLLERFADGRLRPLPVESYPLAEAAAAQRRLESGRTVGKLALIP